MRTFRCSCSAATLCTKKENTWLHTGSLLWGQVWGQERKGNAEGLGLDRAGHQCPALTLSTPGIDPHTLQLVEAPGLGSQTRRQGECARNSHGVANPKALGTHFPREVGGGRARGLLWGGGKMRAESHA